MMMRWRIRSRSVEAKVMMGSEAGKLCQEDSKIKAFTYWLGLWQQRRWNQNKEVDDIASGMLCMDGLSLEGTFEKDGVEGGRERDGLIYFHRSKAKKGR